LKERFSLEYDESGAIGKRYRRQDEIGTPFCVTIDYQTIEDGTVTLRERDSTKQERIKIEEIEGKLNAAIK
jgi:glycyl-tRNA synthetase